MRPLEELRDEWDPIHSPVDFVTCTSCFGKGHVHPRAVWKARAVPSMCSLCSGSGVIILKLYSDGTYEPASSWPLPRLVT